MPRPSQGAGADVRSSPKAMRSAPSHSAKMQAMGIDASSQELAELDTLPALRGELLGELGSWGPLGALCRQASRCKLAISLKRHPDYETGLNSSDLSMKRRRDLRSMFE